MEADRRLLRERTCCMECGVSGEGSKNKGGCIRYGPAGAVLLVMSSTAELYHIQLRKSIGVGRP